MAIPASGRSGGASAAPEAQRRATPLWRPPRDGWIAIAGVVLIYAAHWFYGALISDTAMVMNIIAALLVGGCLVSPRLRNDLLRLKGLEGPAVCFALVVLIALWSLTPWIPGGPHPVWAYVGIAPGASTIDKSATLMEAIKLLGLGCVFVVGLATGARDDRARYAVQLTVAVGVVFGLWAFFASVTGSIYQSGGRRLEAHFLNPNTAGTVFAVLLLLAVTELERALRSRGPGPNGAALPWGMAAFTFAVCLLDTASRGAMGAFLVACLAYMAVQLANGRLRPSRALLAALAGVAALLVVVVVAGDQLVDRLFHSQEASVVRSEIWRLHWRAFLESPLFGYGLGTSETVDKTLITASNYPVLWNIRGVLNVYLQWLEQAGIIGAAPMFACIGLLIFLTLRGTLRRSRMTGLLAGLLAVDVVFLVHGATDFGLEVSSLAALWAWALGLQVSLAQGSSQR